MVSDQKLWTWHLASAVVILVLLGLHMAIMHLETLLGIFNPAGGHPIDWANVVARSRSLFFAVTYTLLLAAALFHGLYGLRNILCELFPARALQRGLSTVLMLLGFSLLLLGSWAAWASFGTAA